MADFTFAHREEGFDNHIDKSIRGYSNLMDDVIGLSRYFIEDHTYVIDIGCSTGKMTQRMIEANQDHSRHAKYVGVEIAEGFFKDLDKREKEINKTYPWANVEFHKEDIRYYNFYDCSLVTSIFTLQFMSINERQEVIKNIHHSLNKGGAFIFAEKTICENAKFQDMLTFNYYDFKRQSFSTEDIMDKERTLRHMLKPNTWEEIEDMIYNSGFSNLQPFWRNHMFVGAIAVK